jgi:phosphatidate cytidylyltransferase
MFSWSTTRHKADIRLKNLFIRTITGAVFVAAIVLSALWQPLVFALLFLPVSLIGLWEYQRLIRQAQDFSIPWLSMSTGLLIYGIIGAFALNYIEGKFLWLILPLILLQSSKHVFLPRQEALQRISTDITGNLLVVIPLALLNIYLDPQSIPGYHTPWFVLGMFAILWTHDTFAYITGSLFGKNPLFMEISPNKTWEGTIGGAGFAFIAAYIIAIFSPELETWHWLVIALIISVFGTIGDLAESLLKRSANVKDSGKVFPGHGGMLDRFDSVLFVSPIVLAFIIIILT